MKPFTATRSMRFVLALYSVTRIVLLPLPADPSLLMPDAGPSPLVVELRGVWRGRWEEDEPLPFATVGDEGGEDEIREKDRRTRGDSSASTWRAFKAEEARRCVGNGVRIVLEG